MEKEFEIKVKREKDYQMTVDFGMDGVPELLLDEPSPLGDDAGPNASRVLAAAVGNCLTASLLFCLEKARVEVGDVETVLHVTMKRNEKGRWRVGGIRARLHPRVKEGEQKRIDRCLDLFEDFCVVTGSIREGFDVDVDVEIEEA